MPNEIELEQAISDLEARLQVCRNHCNELSSAIHAHRKELVELRFKIKEGAIVNSHGKKFRVVSVDVYCSRKPWVKANPIKADGSFGASVRHLYTDWELDTQTANA